VKDDNPKRIMGKIAELVDTLRKEKPTDKIALSSIVHRSDDRSPNGGTDQVNCSTESFSTPSPEGCPHSDASRFSGHFWHGICGITGEMISH